jgi:hypothetical protein
VSKKEDEKNPEDYILDIQKACAELGWDICIENKDAVQGLVIGTDNYVTSVVSQLDDGDDYEIWSYPSEDNSNLH